MRLSAGSDEEGELPDSVRRLFDAAQGPGTAEELSQLAEIVRAMSSLRAPPIVGDELAVRRVRRGPKAATRAAVILAGVLLGASTAAATGVLPDAAQSAVARTTAHVGLKLPDPHGEGVTNAAPSMSDTGTTDPTVAPVASPPADTTPISGLSPDPPDTTGISTVPMVVSTPVSDRPSTSQGEPSAETSEPPVVTTTSVGPDVTDSTKAGLCQAWDARQRNGTLNLDSIDMRGLAAAAQQAGHDIARYCSTVLPSSTSAPVVSSSAPIVTTSAVPSMTTAGTAPVPTAPTVPTSADAPTTRAVDGQGTVDDDAHVRRGPVPAVHNSAPTEPDEPRQSEIGSVHATVRNKGTTT